MNTMDKLHLIPIALWLLREVVGAVVRRAGAKRVRSAVEVAQGVYKAIKDLGWSTDHAVQALRAGLRELGDELGLQPAQVDELLLEGERELGRLLLTDAFGELGKAVDKLKVPVTATH